MTNQSYPPSYHLENNLEKLTLLIRQFPFATVISAHNGDIEVTQAPLVLQEIDGALFLYGHLDSNNPHVNYLDDTQTTVIFHGPNCYISPNDYATKQLPTWNSMSVHIKGHCKTTKDPDDLYQTLEMMADQFEQSSPSTNADFKIQRTEEKTARLIKYITGFKIEVNDIIGRYKLSQDKSDKDIKLAADKLKSVAAKNANELIDNLIT